MPTITLTFDITDTQATKLQRWFDRWNSKRTTPFPDKETFLIEEILKPNVKNFISEQNLIRLPEVPDALRLATDAEQDQIIGILEKYMIGG